MTFVISLLTYKKYTKSVLFAHYKHNVAYFWCNIIDILMTNISVYNWNKNCFSLHDYLPWTIFPKNRIISFIRLAMKKNRCFFNTLLSCEFFLFFVRYRIRSPEVNIQLLLLWFLLSPLNHRKVAYINNFKESTMGCGTCFYTVFFTADTMESIATYLECAAAHKINIWNLYFYIHHTPKNGVFITRILIQSTIA